MKSAIFTDDFVGQREANNRLALPEPNSAMKIWPWKLKGESSLVLRLVSAASIMCRAFIDARTKAMKTEVWRTLLSGEAPA